MKILNNKKIYQALFILVFSLVFNWVFNTQLSFAKQVTLNRNQVSTVFETNNIRRRTQGGTITKKYYVYSQWYNEQKVSRDAHLSDFLQLYLDLALGEF